MLIGISLKVHSVQKCVCVCLCVCVCVTVPELVRGAVLLVSLGVESLQALQNHQLGLGWG